MSAANLLNNGIVFSADSHNHRVTATNVATLQQQIVDISGADLTDISGQLATISQDIDDLQSYITALSTTYEIRDASGNLITFN